MNNIFKVYQKTIMQANEEAAAAIEAEQPIEDPKMKFSVELATEFKNTVNEFTSVCASILQKRAASQELKDRFEDLYGKIKDLADAASKTL